MEKLTQVQYIKQINDYKNAKLYKSKFFFYEFRLTIMTKSDFLIQLKNFEFNAV